MKHNPTLIKESIANLKKTEFYRQRFDACPHFMFFLGDSHTTTVNETKYPFAQKFQCSRFSKNKADWYHPTKELESTADKILKLAEDNPRVVSDMVKDFRKWEKGFYQACKEISGLKIHNLSDKDLRNVYSKLSEIYTKKLNASPLIDGFALTTDTTIARKVERFLHSKGQSKKFSYYFEMLTAPTFIPFLQEEELAFLNIIQELKIHPRQKKMLIREHQKKFFWIQNNYVHDNVLDEPFFLERIDLYKNVDVGLRIWEIENMGKRNTQSRDELIDQLGIPNEIVTLLLMTDTFNQWQDERKRGTFLATHYLSLILEEIAKRTKYTMKELTYCLPPEIEEIFNENITKKELLGRFQDCFLMWSNGNYDIITDTKTIESIVSRDESSKKVKEIRGMSVSLGTATGPVRIIKSIQEIGKVKSGDVLVAVMTRPDYVIAMDKAVAFVTDEGGLTCHAAIVAREMRKPCIVGTKNATSVLKDGDIIQVNANHGWIRIVESE